MNIPFKTAESKTYPDCEEEGEEGEYALSKWQMKEIIDSYVKLNDKLMDRIGQLQEELCDQQELMGQHSFHEEYSIVQANADEVEQLVLSYRQQLSQYQKRMEAQLRISKESVCKLEEQIARMSQKIQQQSQIIEELQGKNIELEEANEVLMGEVEEMRGELMRRQRGKRNSEGSSALGFNETVQLQLEKLINKLMGELQYERNSKRKLTAQIKTLQADIMELEREIIAKNNHIYSQELKNLKSNKSQANLTLNNLRPNHSPPLVHNFSFDGDEQKTKRKLNKGNNVSLRQLNESGELGWQQKINLCMKLIDSYISKLERKDLTLEDEESISVEVGQKGQSVKLPPNSLDKHIGSAQMVVENLLQVLEGVIGKRKSKLAWFNPTQKSVASLLSNLKGRRGSKVEDLRMLRKQLAEVIDSSREKEQ